MLWWLSIAVASAECPAPTSPDEVVAAVDRAEQAFVAMDLDRFEVARAAAESALACVGRVLTPGQAVAVHRLEALERFVARDDAGAVDAYRSVLAIEPAYTPSPALAPKGGPLEGLFASASARAGGATGTVEAPPGDVVWVDGVRTTLRATDRPTIVQLVSPAGAVVFTGGVVPAELFAPPPPAAQAAPVVPEPVEAPVHRGWLPWAIASAGSALAAGGLYAVAASADATLRDPSTPYEDLGGLQSRNHVAVIGSAGTGAAAAALAGVAVVVSLR